MAKRTTHWTHTPERTVSGRMASIAMALANRLVIANVLDSRRSLRRFLFLPVLLLLARGLRWWSRSYLGQRLGFGWSRQTYQAGHDKRYAPADIGDSWRQFRHGSVTMSPRHRQERTIKRP